ncbi:MAG: tRNA lysidine(34) synthetase TilS, partial [Clostridia bacterium]
LCADTDKFPPDAVLRHRQSGDCIEKFGGGTKSLGDFLTDKKVPLRKRDQLIVCADGQDILFVVGIEISKKVAIDGNTKNIVKITEDKNVR